LALFLSEKVRVSVRVNMGDKGGLEGIRDLKLEK